MSAKSARRKKNNTASSKVQAPPTQSGSDTRLSEAQESADSFARIFTKWKIVTYLTVIFLPPYALWRIWSEKSEFRRAEKAVWTMIVIAYVANFIYQFLPA